MAREGRDNPNPRTAIVRIFAAVAVALTLMLAIVPAATAQQACNTHDKIARLLQGRFAEAPVAAGLESSGRLLQVFASSDGATWTMVATAPDGTSCVLAVGEAWQEAVRPQPGPGA